MCVYTYITVYILMYITTFLLYQDNSTKTEFNIVHVELNKRLNLALLPHGWTLSLTRTVDNVCETQCHTVRK